MKHINRLLSVLGLVSIGLLTAATSAQAQNKNSDQTPRTFITPQSASKVRIFEAKQRRSFGLDTASVVSTSTQVGASGSAKSCNTNIGPAAPSGNATSGSGRYGPGSNTRDSTVIVTGDVINVCK